VVRRGEDDAGDLLAARRLEQIVAAVDVGAADILPGCLDGDAAEMDDAVGACEQALDRVEVGEIGSDEGLIGREIRRCGEIAPADGRIDALQVAAQGGADGAGRAGDNDGVQCKPRFW
jgi:hypothetical protein